MEWTIGRTNDYAEGISASFLRNGSEVASGILPVVGLHNLLNATAAIAATERAGIDPRQAVSALGSYEGVKRRQEVLGQANGITVIDDFAHHPSAVKVTCEGLQRRFPNRRLVAVFEPRTNTSRRAIFQDLYVTAFVGVGLVALREPRGADELPESDRFNSHRLAADLRARGTKALAFDDTDQILNYLAQELQSEDVVLIMSNGSFDGIGPRLLHALKERER